MQRRASAKPHSVHITNYYHENSGGVKTNYDRLVASADRLERNVTLIIPSEKNAVENVGRFGRIYRVAAKRAPFVDRRYRMLLPSQYLFSGSAIREILLAERPDVIEIYDNYALTFLAGMTRIGSFRALGRPMFVYFTGERFDNIFKTFVFGGRLGDITARNILRSFTIPMFDYFIAISDFIADELRMAAKCGNGLVSNAVLQYCRRFFHATESDIGQRLAVCHRGVDNGVYSAELRNQETRRELLCKYGLSPDSVLIVSSTRLSNEKNVDLLPRVMKVLAEQAQRDFRLIVCGAGPREEYLRSEFERVAAGRATLAGHLAKPDLAKLYANSDVFFHPNPREPFGNVGLEALMSGAACVFPNSGGVLTYANAANAWLAEPTPQATAASIIAAATDEPERRQKIARAIETAKTFDASVAIDRLFEAHDRFYADFIERKKRLDFK